MHDDKNYLLQTITLDVLLLDKEETSGDKDQKMQKKKVLLGLIMASAEERRSLLP